MTAWQWIGDAALSMVPPILVGGIFWIVMRSILKADSTERKVYQKMEAELRANNANKDESGS
jgi:hypothetical protein